MPKATSFCRLLYLEHVLNLWRTRQLVLPAVVMLAVGLGWVLLDQLVQLFHLRYQGLYGVPISGLLPVSTSHQGVADCCARLPLTAF